MALVTMEGWPIWNLDIKPAFLNGIIDEDIYVKHLEGFVELGKEDKVN